MAPRFLTALTTISLLFGITGISMAENLLEVIFQRMNIDGGGFEYRAIFAANKDGAVSASLTTPLGTYACEPFGNGWIPEQAGSYWNDHFDLPWADFSTLIADDWILIWDEGLATETIAHVGYGTVTEANFPHLPTITYPIDGNNYPAGVWHVDWDYGAMTPEVAQPEKSDIEICIADVMFQPVCQTVCDDVPGGCSLTTAYLTTPYGAGEHLIEVRNIYEKERATADGIGGPITGDPWELDNDEWLALESNALSIINGTIVEVNNVSFGHLKAMYR
jgi:hypothetical protein